jgi:hypothetical protein
MIAFALKQAIKTNQPANIIIQTTKDMIRDNHNVIANILGLKLTDKIKNFDL